MHKVKDNYIAEIIIAIVVSVMILTSCGSTYTCPSYASNKKCCIKTANEVYEYEGLIVN